MASCPSNLYNVGGEGHSTDSHMERSQTAKSVLYTTYKDEAKASVVKTDGTSNVYLFQEGFRRQKGLQANNISQIELKVRRDTSVGHKLEYIVLYTALQETNHIITLKQTVVLKKIRGG